MDEGRKMILVFPTLIKFMSKEDRDLFAPRYFICPICYVNAPDVPLVFSLL
jgi:hypothetical protein